jgi:methionyl-tRNA formyltransferase
LQRIFDTIILMTGAAEQLSLASVLREHNPRLTVDPAATLAELEALAPHYSRARLVSFVSPVVVPGSVLDALGFGAYNFHPGPPDYPGRVPSHFALYDGAATFGATAHAMIERVDAGPIIGVELFPVPPDATVERLDELAFVHAAKLFWRHAKALATQAEPLPTLPTGWRGRKSSRRLHAAMCDIPADIAREELDRRIAAFGAGHYGLNPTVTLHGHKFRYVKADDDVRAPGPGPTDSALAEAAE